ncbi:CMRF35-like molecule 3 isoform X4 [Tachysurus fulvidraco]|uniref:CMRF35-like molecule 3 isoform X4 n=1 Tax=Tachysurus fulvidraco TaxID=1234273 RepID=UPI001FEF65A2|nr:CMRF35-like molecule 3 isoform X4 [Tachysurus fulvidraco]
MFYQSGRPATSSLFFLLINTKSGTDAVTIVTGYRGGSVQIKCPYKSGYEDNKKYLCRGECSYVGNKDIPVESGSPAKDPRFSLYDDKTARVFTVTITDLRPEDGGTYWCVIERTLPLSDIYTKILLQVKTDDPTISSVSHTTHTPTHGDTTHSVTDKLLTYTTHKTPITSSSQASSSAQSLKSSSNPRVLPAPACDYEEVKDSRALSNTIYCTAQLSTNLPDGSETIYCNTELPTTPTVYSTAQNPSDSPDQDFYSSAQLPSAVCATSPSVVKSGESPMYAAVNFETSSYGAAPTAVYKNKSNSCVYATVNS